uniref:Uncharacterized protein n=1 Tax=Cucumis sativus TaxID=3659 RepID=A0A0A0KB97_CUCSA
MLMVFQDAEIQQEAFAVRRLKEKFYERTRCPQSDEPLYKDVAGSGGLQVSSLDSRLLEFGNEVKTLRESLENKKVTETSESISNE